MRGDAPGESGLRLAPEQGRLVGRLLALGGEARQNRRPRLGPKGAALRDLEGRLQCLRHVGKESHHFGARLEPVLGGELATISLRNRPPLGDADQRVVRLIVVG